MEQANLMQDHIWLLDLNEVFKNKRHIILLTPDSSINQAQADIQNEILVLGQQVSKKID